MNIIELLRTFQTQEQCLAHLERVRWGDQPACLYCGSVAVGRHASGDRAQQRWQCRDCHRAFAVTVGTIFHQTHMPLQQWFLVLALMLNAKKSASACQIARDLGIRRATVWSMMHRVRVAMARDAEQSRLLYGIVEADETYVGGKPRKANRREDDPPKRNGRGTEKACVLGACERGGRVTAQVSRNASGASISKFLTRVVDVAGTVLMTDQWNGYRVMETKVARSVVNHAVEYANGITHTNSIEGFWGLLKRALHGQHHHWSLGYMPLYVSEACYKYNARKDKDDFGTLVRHMLGV